MPLPGELPDEISVLARRYAFELSNSRWDFDVGRLATVIEESKQRGPVGRLAPGARWRWRPVAAVVGLGAAATAAAGPRRWTRLPRWRPASARTGCRDRTTCAPRARASPKSTNRRVRSRCSTRRRTSPAPGRRGPASTRTAWRDRRHRDQRSGDDRGERPGPRRRIESPCGSVEAAYSFGSMGTFDRLPPFTAKQGDIWGPTAGGSSWSPTPAS
jgi:hypothetical protein